MNDNKITRRGFNQLAGGALAVAAAPAVLAQGTSIKIGVLLPLSGPLATLGNDVMRGFQMAQEWANAEGGVFGQQVELVVADVPSSTEAVSQANRLISKDGVKVIVGSYASSISIPASQVAERNKVIYLEQGAVADEVSKRGFKYLFRMIYPATELGVGAARFATDTIAPGCGIDLSKLKVALLTEDSSYGSSVAEGAKAWLAKKGITPIDATSYSYKTTDLSSMVQRYKSIQPDLLIACQYTPDGILFARQAREAGLNFKAMLGNGGAHNVNDFADALLDDVNGIFNAGTSVNINPKGLTPETAVLFKRFHEGHVKKYAGRTPSAHTGMGFTAMNLLLKRILPDAGSMDVEKIRTAALALDMPVGSTIVGWGVKFDPTTQNNTRAFPTYDQWRARKIVTIAPDPFGLDKPVAMPLPEWGKRGSI
jgi:branched-chain amino acid transport system substrate-binding protein